MADHYFAVTGSGSGTGADANNPQTFSTTALNTAEAAASSGDTIFFLSGNYSISSLTFDGPSGITYKSLNLHGAKLTGNGTLRQITIGQSSTNSISLRDFYFEDVMIAGSFDDGNGVKNILSGIKHIDSTALNRTTGMFNQCDLDVSESTFLLQYTGTGNKVFRICADLTLTSVSMHYEVSGLPANDIAITGGGFSANSIKNCIFSSDDNSVFASSHSLAGSASYSCFHNQGSSNTSGGTNNIFADPQFVDSVNGDFHLRPTSPCIGAGTSS